MPVGAVAETKLYVGPGASAPAPASISPDQYVEITNIANIGDVGTMFNKIAVEAVDSGYTKQIKGTEMNPTFSLVLNRLDTDPGQEDLKDAAANRNNFYPFRLVENDGEGVLASSTRIYFNARVYGFLRKYGGVNNLKQVQCDLEIEPDSITIVAPE